MTNLFSKALRATCRRERCRRRTGRFMAENRTVPLEKRATLTDTTSRRRRRRPTADSRHARHTTLTRSMLKSLKCLSPSNPCQFQKQFRKWSRLFVADGRFKTQNQIRPNPDPDFSSAGSKPFPDTSVTGQSGSPTLKLMLIIIQGKERIDC